MCIGERECDVTHLSKVQTTFTNFNGGPGVSTQYFLDTATACTSLRSMWDALTTVMPLDVTIQVQNYGDIIEDTTGDLVDSWAQASVAPSTGLVSGPYAAPVGGHLIWDTATVLDGHRVRGRTFVVPMGGSQFTAIGTVLAGAEATMNAQAAGLVSSESGQLVVWHRPFAGRAAVGTVGTVGYKPAKAAHAGSHAVVTGGRGSALATILRSRRD